MATNFPNYPLTQTAPMVNPAYPQLNTIQSFFPQPVGSVYNLTTASEIGNIPAGTGVSVGLCIPEGVMYVKSLQNGAPMLLEYKLSSIDPIRPPERTSEHTTAADGELKQILNSFKSLEEKINHIEGDLTKVKEKMGGKLEWQI